MSLWLSLIALTGLLGLSAPTASATEAAGPRKIRPANESATERRDLRAFDAVKVSHGIQLILSQADEYRVEVTADRNLLPLVRTDGTLNCSELQLDAENGSNISGAFRADRVSASADTASTIDMISLTCSTLTASADLSSEVIGTLRSCNEATLDASNCSTIDLRGNCRTLTAHASVYATLSLRRLNCERAELTATQMAVIDSTVHERLSATVASGGTVTYAGNPTLDEINTHKNGNFYRR